LFSKQLNGKCQATINDHIIILLFISLVLGVVGCDAQMIAEIGGTPPAQSSKYLTSIGSGLGINKNTREADAYIYLELKNDIPKPAYLRICFETPEGLKTVEHQITSAEYTKGIVYARSPVAAGWKPAGYLIDVGVFVDKDYTQKADALRQPWRNYFDIEKTLGSPIAP
jgi:hypothetical protein